MSGKIVQVAHDKKGRGSNLYADFLMISVALICGGIGGVASTKYMSKPEGPKVAVIDTIKAMQAIDPKDPEAANKVTTLAQQIKTKAAQYAEQGYIVLDASYVLTMPSNSIIPLSGDGHAAK